MPRLPFLRFGPSIAALLSVSSFVAAGLVGGGGGGGPTAVIVASATNGQAPFAVHAHALNSILDAGTELTARYEWDFGDPAGAYNTLVGWNAAHIYNDPGTYTLKLKVTNEAGQSHTELTTITITAPSRTTIYVSPAGNDSNSGLSPASAIKTFAKAATMLGNNKAILFERGATFSVSSAMAITQQNVIIGAYGTGEIPKLNWIVNSQYDKIINMGSSAMDVVVENIRFDSNFAPDNLIVRGLQAHGYNITVRGCHFGNISYAMNTDGEGVDCLLTQNNTAGVIGAYYIWSKGNDHTHLGNDVDGSVHEHNIRFGVTHRCLIAHNDLRNTSKSTIWCMLGEHCYIADNILRDGRFLGGPNFATSTPSERFKFLVFENNHIINEGVILYSGAEDMVFRNNVIHYNAGEIFSIWGYYAPWNRTCKNISLLNNTGFNESTEYGRFLRLGNDAENVVAANNLYCATALNSTNGAANVKSEDTNLNTHAFHHNIWATPDAGNWPHTMATGGQTVAQWSAYSETWDETYRSFNPGDLDGQYEPQFDADTGVSVAGVFTDFYGNPRPTSGVCTLGAVEANTVPPTGIPGDLNNDGLVNVDDLLLLFSYWGSCPPSGSCLADVDQDGKVDTEDLLALIIAWT